jgi:ABC-type multidrug transport system fused ATPase/permease subunit
MFDFENQNQLILFFLILLLIIYSLKTIYLIFITYKQNVFLQNFNVFISTSLFKTFLNQKYSYHLKKSYTELNKILSQDSAYFDVYCSSIIILISEFSLLISIILTVLLIEPVGTLFSFLIIFLMAYFFYSFNRNKLNKWSTEREKLEKELSKVALESLKGYKEIMIYQRHNFFNSIFKEQKKSLNNIKAKFKTMNVIPRYYIEFMALISLTIYILFYIYLGKNLNYLLPTLGVFVAAVFKISPSMNKIITALQNLKFYDSSLNIIFDELKNKNNSEIDINQKKALNKFEELEIKELKFMHSGAKNYVLNKVNLKIKKGERIGIIGESGQGKTTLIDLIFGFHQPTEGKIIVNDSFNINDNTEVWRKKIAYVSQEPFLINATISENISFGININLDLI